MVPEVERKGGRGVKDGAIPRGGKWTWRDRRKDQLQFLGILAADVVIPGTAGGKEAPSRQRTRFADL